MPCGVFVDSGATHHLVNDVDLFYDPVTPVRGNPYVQGTGGEEFQVVVHGSMLLQDLERRKLLRTDIFLVSHITTHVVSVQRLSA